MYKKILSVALAILMVCSCFVLSVSAEGLTEEEALMQTLKEAYIEQWKEDYKDTYDLQWFDGTLSYFYYIGEAGCHVFQAAAISGSPVEPTDEIGDYRFTAHMCMSYCDTNPSGTYAYKDGELMTLKEAYNKGLVDLDALYEVTDSKYTMTRLSDEEILENKCKAEFIEEFGIPTEDEKDVSVLFAVEFENYTVFLARSESYIDEEMCVYKDGYWFYNGTVAGHYTLDKYGNVETIDQTADKGFIDLDEIFPVISELTEMHLRGDADGDKQLTIKDATLIQKYLAKYPDAVEKIWTHPIMFHVADANLSGLRIDAINDDSEINIKDATYIQKKVAKMIKEEESTLFADNAISIHIWQDEVKEYTVEDFPEFEAEKVERWDSGMLELTVLTVYLKNPGKSNVINAVNSLKYREGTEFDSVDACYKDTDA